MHLQESTRDEYEATRATGATSHNAPPYAASGSSPAIVARPAQASQLVGTLPNPTDAIAADTVARRGEDEGSGRSTTTTYLFKWIRPTQSSGAPSGAVDIRQEI